MVKRRKAAPVTLTDRQRERLERLWFYYGNYGPAATPGNHQFIQGLLEHGIDLRPLHTKRTPKRDRPTEECEAAVEAVLHANGGEDEGPTRFGILRLVAPLGSESSKETPDPELKRMLDEMLRRRQTSARDRGGLDAGGKDTA